MLAIKEAANRVGLVRGSDHAATAFGVLVIATASFRRRAG